jgi:alkylhydroperoxidase/carboxymuconolactone decarboxylase family protein YurZ
MCRNIETLARYFGFREMGFLSTNMQAFVQSLDRVDAVLEESCPLDKKTDELMRFALSLKARSKACVRKHYRGSINAGASQAEIAYVFALTMREAAGADDCWTHSVIGDLVDATPGGSTGCG